MISSIFRNNRAAFPSAELAKHTGQWVAFSPDGTAIVAADADLDEVETKVKAAGHKPSQVVLEFVPGEDYDVYLGGGELI